MANRKKLDWTVRVDMSKSKTRKADLAAVNKAYAAFQDAVTTATAHIAGEMISAGHIPAGTVPALSWVNRFSGELEAAGPKVGRDEDGTFAYRAVGKGAKTGEMI